MGVSLETYRRRRRDVLMGRRAYVPLRRGEDIPMRRRCQVILTSHHDVPIRCRGDVPLRRLGDVPSRRRWVFHLRRNCDVAGTYRETLLRWSHDILLPSGSKYRALLEFLLVSVSAIISTNTINTFLFSIGLYSSKFS